MDKKQLEKAAENLVYENDELREKIKSFKEICICAAVKSKSGKIARGHRHMHCFDVIEEWGEEIDPYAQGFMTSFNRFVDRKEGLRLQLEAGVESVGGGYRHQLYSEDLY